MNIAPLVPYLFLVSFSAWFSFSACCCWRCGRSWAELAVLRRRIYPPPCIDIARLFQFSLFPTHKEKERKERLRGPEECFFFFLFDELGPHLPPTPAGERGADGSEVACLPSIPAVSGFPGWDPVSGSKV